VIPTKKIKEPGQFDDDVRKPGTAWLASNPAAKRPSPFWNQYTRHLSDGFLKLCGYAAMMDPTGGTVDHYLSYKNHPAKTYDWANYRFASGTLNASKKTADDTVLDPYQVGAGWFEILLPSLQLQVTDKVPLKFRAKAEFTLKRLKLRDGERVIRWRQSYYELYKSGDLTLEGLRKAAPLIAEAVDRALAVNGQVP